jgi:hypothetical protein
LRSGFLLLAFLGLLAGCGAEPSPGPPPASPPLGGPRAQRGEATGAAGGGYLRTSGRKPFAGRAAFRCLPHAEGGLQISFRTGHHDLPAVAVTLESFGGEGHYKGRLFVTGRGPSGALVRSTGETAVEVKQRESQAAVSAVLLAGEIQGRYAGAAGQGEIEGRFGPCWYTPPLTSTPRAESVDRSAGSAPRPRSG